MSGRISAAMVSQLAQQLALVSALLLAGMAPGLAAEGGGEANRSAALDLAFRFASSIEGHPEDKAKAQEQVVQEAIELGLYERARAYAEAIDGWRQGLAFANLATLRAQKGDADQARELIERAKRVRRGAKEWRGPRIDAHVAQAVAALGEVDRAESTVKSVVEKDAEYKARGVATAAAAKAETGDVDAAMEHLDSLEGSKDHLADWWRTVGYAKIARRSDLPFAERLEAADAARRAADQIRGWKRAEALRSVAEIYAQLERPQSAGEAARAAAAIVEAVAHDSTLKVPLMANMARTWARLGKTEEAQRTLEEARPLVGKMLSIDQAATLGSLAAAWYESGQRDHALALFGDALDNAAGLVNSRPRALALVTITRFIARHDVPLQEGGLGTRLEGMLADLGAPW